MQVLEPATMRWARIQLASLLLVILAGVALSVTDDPTPPFIAPPGATNDLDVFGRIVDRVRGGEGFYDATQSELRSHGYPTRSVFNWRTPCYAWLLGNLPDDRTGLVIISVTTLAVLAMASVDLLRDVGLCAGATAVALMAGSMAWAFKYPSDLFTELWAGVAIAFSVCALRRGRTALGVAAGLFALFYRELALPYVLVSFGLAAWHGRKREAVAWAVGLAAFIGFMAVHAHVVASRLTSVDTAMIDGGWVRFGGARFVLSTARMNIFLMCVPAWCTAIVLPLAVFGVAHWRGETGRRVGLTLLLYLLAFAIVGNPYNHYWGFMDAPLIMLSVGYAPSAIRRTVAAAGLGGAEPFRQAQPAGSDDRAFAPHAVAR
jgi:hypothetical protein